MKFVFIADFFAHEINGGGEQNNDELIKILKSGHQVETIKSQDVTLEFLKKKQNSKFIIANFIRLSNECKHFLVKTDYVIYEHDHKYLKSRNPADYKDFIAPKEEIINYDFYKNAKKIFCQSSLHQSIVQDNLKLDNIENLSGNLWSFEDLNKMRLLSENSKIDKCSIMMSPIAHKNTDFSIVYCLKNNFKYELIPPCSSAEFLHKLSKNQKFVFFPKTPETLSRIVVEARMMNIVVITNKLVGAIGEEWFKFKGYKLIDVMLKKREEISNNVLKAFFENAE